VTSTVQIMEYAFHAFILIILSKAG
jgi:hypothetical protein